jgi:hypothetical protein
VKLAVIRSMEDRRLEIAGELHRRARRVRRATFAWGLLAGLIVGAAAATLARLM